MAVDKGGWAPFMHSNFYTQLGFIPLNHASSLNIYTQCNECFIFSTVSFYNGEWAQ